MRSSASATFIRPRTGFTALCHSFASATLMLMPAWRPSSGRLCNNVPRGKSIERDSSRAATGIANESNNRMDRKRAIILAGQQPSFRLFFCTNTGEGSKIVNHPLLVIADQQGTAERQSGNIG